MIFGARLGKRLRAVLFSLYCLFFIFTISAFAQQAEPKPVRFDAGTVSGLPARNIGSATMSGRIAAVTAFSDKGRLTVFAGAAGGGGWMAVHCGSRFPLGFVPPSL